MQAPAPHALEISFLEDLRYHVAHNIKNMATNVAELDVEGTKQSPMPNKYHQPPPEQRRRAVIS